MKRLYLLRHGQTEFNVKKLVQGRCDSPLTDLGRQQAQAAAEWIKAHGVVPDKVVSSPLGRAMDFGGEGSRALQERMVDTLTNLMGAEGIETLLAVSHGSASRQFIKAAAPEGFELPAKLPNCAIMIFDFDEQKPQAEGEPMQCKFTLQQIVDPQQCH